jgi:predicted ATPase
VSNDLWILTGAPGSGKTAILDELRGSIRCVDEPARRVLADQRATGGPGTPERDPTRFVELLLEIAIADHERASLGGGPTLFDRGIPDCIAYAIHLGVDPHPSVHASDGYRYHDEVLIVEPWEEIYATDDERTMPFADTVAFHAVLEDVFDRSGYRRVTVPRGAPTDRAAFVSERTLGQLAADSGMDRTRDGAASDTEADEMESTSGDSATSRKPVRP